MYNENVIVRKNFSIKAKTIMAFIAIVGAVALPQIAHLGGALIGVDNAIGTTLLPMHFAVILVGLLAGGYAGALAGVMAPLVSHWLTAMPTAQMLPIMMVELGAYGLVAGMLSKVEMNILLKVLLTQVMGRVLRAMFVFVLVHTMGNGIFTWASIWAPIQQGLPGIALQLITIPLLYKFFEKRI
ncbi:MAG: ECF transporter S component [Tissierellia bacterium]|nr:ECF transporter S component [Tissierellia bacterium]